MISLNSVPFDSITVDSQVAAVKAANPEAVYLIFSSYPSAVAILKGLRAAGVTAPFYGADSMNDNNILNEAPEASEGLTVATFSSGSKAFQQALSNEYQSEEVYGAAVAYDAFEAVYRAIQTGATTGEQVKDALRKVDFQGVSGRIKFNAEGEVTDQEHRYTVLQARGGTFMAVE